MKVVLPLDTGPEIVKTEKPSGFLIKPGDAEEAASRVMEILKDGDLSRAMREKGREYVKANFSYTNIIERIIEEYQNCS